MAKNAGPQDVAPASRSDPHPENFIRVPQPKSGDRDVEFPRPAERPDPRPLRNTR